MASSPLVSVYQRILQAFPNAELAEFHLRVDAGWALLARRPVFARAHAAQLIGADGRPEYPEVLLEALSAEVNRRVDAGTFC